MLLCVYLPDYVCLICFRKTNQQLPSPDRSVEPSETPPTLLLSLSHTILAQYFNCRNDFKPGFVSLRMGGVQNEPKVPRWSY